jgi:hypothetical protein
MVIQQRDRLLLQELATMRLIDRESAKVVCGFGSTTRANTRLLKLTRAGLLNRFFVGTISAGRKAVYTLSRKGGLLVNAEFRPISRAHGQTLVGDLFVNHQEHINLIYTAVKFRALPSGLRLLRWRAFQRPLTKYTRLIPDGYFELQTASGVRPMFLEVDLGHEAMKVWEQKTRGYLQLAVSGEFARLFGQPQFRVLVIANSKRRLAGIRATIAKHTDKIFWLSEFPSINQSGLWASVWARPTGDHLSPLL